MTCSAWGKAAMVVQLMIATVVLLVLAFAPPDRGEMLLVPLSGRTISPALLSRLPLVPERAGPLPGSLLVFGSSEGHVGQLLNRGVLVLSAPQPMCGTPYPKEDA